MNEAKAAKVKSTDKRASDVVSAMILKGLGVKITFQTLTAVQQDLELQ